MSDPSWLGRPADGQDGQPVSGVFATDLELPVLDSRGRGAVRKAALIDIGQPRDHDEALVVPVSWRSATVAPLFPVFAGELRISVQGIELVGRYAPPFGRLGLVIDATLLHVAARRTGQAFVARVAAHLGSPRLAS